MAKYKDTGIGTRSNTLACSVKLPQDYRDWIYAQPNPSQWMRDVLMAAVDKARDQRKPKGFGKPR
ncbi:MAG: hypothetical protein HC851_21770 [Acaryochloris sp. RU_4_1]|nr:hypothetical protein [Acaryochloris sp. RU_4_1]NJR56627.1 hypothetical protein [Acaryochloris sp. CRU_2_0]